MNTALKWGGVTVMGVAFWIFYDIGGSAPHEPFNMFDKHTILGLGAWISALWVGRLLEWKS